MRKSKGVTDESIHAVYRRSMSGAETKPLSSRAISRDNVLEIVTFLASPAKVSVKDYGEYEAPTGMYFRQFPLHVGGVSAHVERVVGWRNSRVLVLNAPEVVSARGWREDNAMVCWSSDIGREWAKDFPSDAMPIVTENADDDGDGLPNWFEMLYFGHFPDASTAYAAKPGDDPDQDGPFARAGQEASGFRSGSHVGGIRSRTVCRLRGSRHALPHISSTY